MKTLANRAIVAIDDTPSILTFLGASLEAMGADFYETMTASGGLAMCKKIKPDLVILDLGLPDKEGFQILPELKHLDRGKGGAPIVIVLTVRNDPANKETAEKLGADAYVTKPFRMEDLIEVIHHKLGIAPAKHLQLVTPH